MDIVKELNKLYGAGSIIKLGDKEQSFEYISTTCPALDEALGGGIVKNRIIEISGKEGCGKTTLALHILSNVKRAAYIDVEHALDPTYAKNLGVNVKDLYLSQPDSAEQALNMVEYMCRDGSLDLIVVDSVAALIPMAEVEGEMEDSEMAKRARLMSKAMRKLVPLASKGTTIIFINQVRANISGYGNPTVTTGGYALRYAASQRIQLAQKGKDEKGIKVKATIIKNKVATPYKECEFDLIFGEGISKELGLINKLIDNGTFKKSASWITYEDYKWQGLEAARLALKENKELTQILCDLSTTPKNVSVN